MHIDSGHFSASPLPGEADAFHAFSLAQDEPTLAETLDAAAARHGDAPLTIQSALHGGVVTLAALHRQSQALAGALYALGLRQGDVMAIQTPAWLEQVLLIRAAAALGAAILPVNARGTPVDTGRLLRDARATALVLPDRLQGVGCADRLAAMGALPSLRQLIVIGNDAPAGAVRWKDLLGRATPHFPAPARLADDVAALVFTPESAAAPTSVSLGSRALLAAVAGRHGEIAAPTLSLWPSGHIGGLVALLRHALDGTPTYLMEEPQPAEAARLVERHRIAAVCGEPSDFAALLETATAQGADLGSLREFQTGAASLPPALAARCEALGVRVIAERFGG